MTGTDVTEEIYFRQLRILCHPSKSYQLFYKNYIYSLIKTLMLSRKHETKKYPFILIYTLYLRFLRYILSVLIISSFIILEKKN